MRIPSIACLVLSVLAGFGCARANVGEGAETTAPAVRVAAPEKPERPTLIVNSTDATRVGGGYIVGDVDGDGLDDFIVEAVEIADAVKAVERSTVQLLKSQVYLFYGRREFPEQMSLSDADASFATHFFAPWPLGDVNGDGLADFALTQPQTAYEIVLGNRKRFEGAHDALATGVVWTNPIAPGFTAPLAATLEGAGDVNCDGIDDLLMHASRFLPENDDEIPLSGLRFAENTYVVLGAKAFPEEFSPSRALARFGQTAGDERVFGAQLVLTSIGDLDGDGCDDLVATGDGAHAVFYGGKSRFKGQFGPRNADVVLKGRGGLQKLADLDGDGADEIALEPPSGSEFRVQYGSRKRWSGERMLTPELTLSGDGMRFSYDTFSFDSGDTDLDGSTELLIGFARSRANDDEHPNAHGAVYGVQPKGTRLTGAVTLTDAELLFQGPDVEAAWDEAAGPETSLNSAGDVDGDGARDVLRTAPSASGNNGAVVLLASGRDASK